MGMAEANRKNKETPTHDEMLAAAHRKVMLEAEARIDNQSNYFDNKVVIIDEAHNFVSRIVNKIGKERQEETIKSNLIPTNNALKYNNELDDDKSS